MGGKKDQEGGGKGEKEGGEGGVGKDQMAMLVEEMAKKSSLLADQEGTMTLRLDAIVQNKQEQQAAEGTGALAPGVRQGSTGEATGGRRQGSTAGRRPPPEELTKTLGRGWSKLQDVTGEPGAAASFSLAGGDGSWRDLAGPVAAAHSLPGRAQNKEKVNQDTTLISVMPSSGINVYAVFDGHGPIGETASTWLRKNIVKTLDLALGDGTGSEARGDGLVVSVTEARKSPKNEP